MKTIELLFEEQLDQGQLLKFDGYSSYIGAGEAVDIIDGNESVEAAGDGDIEQGIAIFLSKCFVHGR